MERFPIVGWDHLDRVPGTAIEKRAIRAFARTLLTANAEIRIDFDPSKRRVVLVGNPKHTGFNRTIFDTRRRTGAAGAAISRDRQYARALLARRLSVALRHWPVLVYDIEHPFLSLTFLWLNRVRL